MIPSGTNSENAQGYAVRTTMLKFSAREKTLVLSVALSLGIAELFLEFQASRARDVAAAQIHPFYSFELQDSEGRRISSNKGMLKLRLDPLAGYTNRPNIQTPYFSIDANGFREVPDSKKIAPSSTVAIVGGSTAFSTGASNDTTTYENYVAQGLKTVHVINAATIGHTSANELGIFTSRLVDQGVNAIVSVTGWNDYQQWTPTQASENLLQIEQRLVQIEQARDASLPARYLLGFVSTFFPAMQRKVQELLSPHRGVELPGFGVIREPLVKLDPVSAARNFTRHRKTMRRIANPLGIQACAIIQPDLNDLNAQQQGLSHPYGVFRKEVIQQARDEGLDIFDAGASPSPLQPSHFTDAIHLTDEGNKVFAEYTLPFIRSCALKETAPPKSPS